MDRVQCGMRNLDCKWGIVFISIFTSILGLLISGEFRQELLHPTCTSVKL